MTNIESIAQAEKQADNSQAVKQKETLPGKETFASKTYKQLADKAKSDIEDTGFVDTNNHDYVDQKTGRIINDSIVDGTTTDGTVTSRSSGNHTIYEFVPASRLKTTASVTDNDYNSVDKPSFQSKASGQDGFQELNAPDKENKQVLDTLKYSFGLDDVVLAKKQMHEVTGFISPVIELNDCYYITLEGPAREGLEYSVVENGTETPILPAAQTKITKEKIFHGLNLRFAPESAEDVVIYNNDSKTNYAYQDIKTLQPSESVTYTADYTPIQSGHYYYPEGKKIQIKLIQRNEQEKHLEPITQILVKEYGGASGIRRN